MHKKPSPCNPSWHLHKKLPTVLVQEAFLWHGYFVDLHSFTSMRSQWFFCFQIEDRLKPSGGKKSFRIDILNSKLISSRKKLLFKILWKLYEWLAENSEKNCLLLTDWEPNLLITRKNRYLQGRCNDVSQSCFNFTSILIMRRPQFKTFEWKQSLVYS